MRLASTLRSAGIDGFGGRVALATSMAPLPCIIQPVEALSFAMMSSLRHTKIVATLGPSTESDQAIAQLVEAGVNVFRINASHGSHESHGQLMQRVRAAGAKANQAVGVLYDLQGPKIRLGRFEGERAIAKDDLVTIVVGSEPKDGEFSTDHKLLDKDVKTGDPLLIDDGNLFCVVEEVKKGVVTCRAQNRAVLTQRKGINLPQSEVSVPAITPKDREDIKFAMECGVDLFAMSFVRKGDDVRELREILNSGGCTTPILAKIEKPQALENLDDILANCWGVMVARGDLGVELPPEDVPMVQKRVINAANRAGRPVVTATQMLESMTRKPRPTRAETSDVANAVLDGTDAVMLSGETATGDYPVESVRMMARIIDSTEGLHRSPTYMRRSDRHVGSLSEAVADAGVSVASHLDAERIVVFTETGRAAIYASQRHPHSPTFAFTPREDVRNRLALVWGVYPYLVERSSRIDERIVAVDAALLGEGLAREGDDVVLLMRSPNMPPGSCNVMMVHTVGTSKNLPVG